GSHHGGWLLKRIGSTASSFNCRLGMWGSWGAYHELAWVVDEVREVHVIGLGEQVLFPNLIDDHEPLGAGRLSIAVRDISARGWL
ncbi:hypothetical protein, partial [Pseudomonas syringae]